MKENELKEINCNYALKYEELVQHYVDAENSAKEAYLLMLEDAASTFQDAFNQLGIKIDKQKKSLEYESNLVQLAVEARKRAEEEEEKRNFYRLQIPQCDLEDIEKLNEVALLLNTPESLYKTIWKVYYEKPYTDLIGRVLGTKPITGIYKITNINNGKSYVGQSTNVQERWKQHIKRGCGAEAPTRNKLYPAMIEQGVHNFYFELLEECPRDQLDLKEDYWQNFFQTTTYGYSIK